MESLRNVRITVKQDCIFIETRSQDENADLVAGLLEPLKSVKVAVGRQVDIVAVDLTVRLLLGDVLFPFTIGRTCSFPKSKTDPVTE